jgi:hypothetical protein
VHGRMEEASFARYVRRKRDSGTADLAVNAHLCEVLRLGQPQESKRNRTWFSAEKAKQRLGKDRSPAFAAELARVVDRAGTRIQQLLKAAAPETSQPDGPQLGGPRKDALQKVRFEAVKAEGVQNRMVEASFAGYSGRQRGDTDHSHAIELALDAYLCKVLRLGPAQEWNRNPALFSAHGANRRLLDGPTPEEGAEPARVVVIDNARGEAGRAKSLGATRKNRRIPPIDQS